MTQPNRLETGGLIDRTHPLAFTFNGRPYEGFQGDTVASALLANGAGTVARSFKYHRRRGVMTAGPEEPNALLQVGIGARTTPNVPATQQEVYDGLVAGSVNASASLRADWRGAFDKLSSFLPPGFYYKTLMGPRFMWKTYEHRIRETAGLGLAPESPDPDRYDKMNAHCDVLVVGSGPAGLAAALEAGGTGARVTLVEQDSRLGGQLLSDRVQISGGSGQRWAASVADRLSAMEEVQVLTRSTALGYYHGNFVTVLERRTDHSRAGEIGGPRNRLWRIRAKRVVLATGAIERPLVFPNNDRPGIMLASAVSAYINRYAVLTGTRCVVFTNNDSAYRTALDLRSVGADVTAIVDTRPRPIGELPELVQHMGIYVASGHAVVNTMSGDRVRGVKIGRLNKDANGVTGRERTLDCDLVAVSGGWSPSVHLHSQSGAPVVYDSERACFVPGEPMLDGVSVGSASGDFRTADCLAQGAQAGAAAAADAGFGSGTPTEAAPEVEEASEEPAMPMWLVPTGKPVTRGSKRFVDFQTDVTAADIVVAASEGYESIEHVKRYTTLGMGTDQGKLGNVNGIGILGECLGKEMPEVGVTTFRPLFSGVAYGAIAGSESGDLFDPVRTTAIHGWHVEAGAEFENVGQWKRPWYYPKTGESMHEAVNRECLAVRSGVGILDASTLGKIEIEGPDAAEFLNRMCTNPWKSLWVGKCRYGLMLGEDGNIMDDGVTGRLAEDRFLMHTTTSGAAAVFTHLERWLQTEWPDLKVYLTSSTDHWATISLNGPKAREVAEAICTGIDFSNDEFPFMSVREGACLGVPARVFRIAFAGELSYEINVNANYGRAVWEAAMDAGRQFGITPYGTEAMHVLRAEKGFIIVGQDTDGSMTPQDMGLDRLVSKRKDFIGRRSLSRSEIVRTDRKQFVGLLTEDPGHVLSEGGQVLDDSDTSKLPVPMIGHVTSSYWSACLGRSIALGVVKGGHEREGETVYVSTGPGDAVPAKISSPVFYDRNAERQNV